MKKLPEVYWKKCIQAVKIAQYKGYPLDIVMVGLIKNKPDPKVEFIHTYDFTRKSNKYLHSISIKITI